VGDQKLVVFGAFRREDVEPGGIDGIFQQEPRHLDRVRSLALSYLRGAERNVTGCPVTPVSRRTSFASCTTPSSGTTMPPVV